jgi:hypothetical protein
MKRLKPDFVGMAIRLLREALTMVGRSRGSKGRSKSEKIQGN